MNNFKFLGKRPTKEELKDHAFQFSHPLRFHEKGCMISKSAYRVFILGKIEDGEITTYKQVEKEILDIAIDPDTLDLLEGEQYYAGEYNYYLEEDNYDEETIQNELDLDNQN
jgi:hypothetical protein